MLKHLTIAAALVGALTAISAPASAAGLRYLTTKPILMTPSKTFSPSQSIIRRTPSYHNFLLRGGCRGSAIGDGKEFV